MWVSPLVVAFCGLAGLGNPARHPILALGWLMVASLAWAIAVNRLEARLDGLWLLGVAALLRLLLLPLEPGFSDDTLRYLWDGRVVAAGANPYLVAPEDPRLAPLRDAAWDVMPHKHVPTVYPPLALVVFTAAGMLPDPLVGLKIILVLADLVGCWILVLLARRLEVPAGRVAWYAWNPLVVLEIAGQGHVDALMVPFMILAVFWLLAPSRPMAAGSAAAAGVLAKLVPLLALPLWSRTLMRTEVHRGPVRQAGWQGGWWRGATGGWWRGVRGALLFLAAALLVTAVGLLPVVISAGGVPPGLVTYGVAWEWNGPIYEPLWRAIAVLDPIDAIKGIFDRVKLATGWHDVWNRFYPFVYPQFLAKLVLLAGFGVFYARELLGARRSRHPVTVSGRVFGAVILVSATVYPWYLLWVLPWAALGRRRSWLALSALAPLSYLPQHLPQSAAGGLFPWVWGAMWLPFFALLVVEPPWPFELKTDLEASRICTD